VRLYTNLVENASIDECFADFTDALKGVKDVNSYFKDFQKELYNKTGLYCSIGIASTKFLAKMGSDYKKPNGITIIRKKDIANIIYPLPIKDMFGVGKKTQPRLQSIGIKTIGELANKVNKEDEDVKNILGKFFYVVRDWLNGKGDDQISIEESDPKSIGNSTTLASDTNNYEEIKITFEELCKEVSFRAIEENKVGHTVQIVVKEPAPSFRTFNKSITFDKPTNDYNVILQKALMLYDTHFADKVIRLVGVTLQNLVSKKDMSVQMTLFDFEQHEEECATNLLINSLNRKLKKQLLMKASDLTKEKK
jgi:DNA polymerase-4